MANKITIDGVEYTRAIADGDRMLFQLIDRNNLIGNAVLANGYWTLTNASVIRYWGTVAGLGEIAADGPTSKTRLDPIPDGTKVPESAVIFAMPA